MERINFSEWEMSVPEDIRTDSVWKVRAYRLGLFLSDLCWHDVGRLMGDKRSLGMVDQMARAVGSISANIEEGYSRGTGRDRARFYEYALGSARESRGWYYKARHILSEEVTGHRLQLSSEIIKLLLTMVPNQRGGMLREENIEYRPDLSPTLSSRSQFDSTNNPAHIS